MMKKSHAIINGIIGRVALSVLFITALSVSAPSRAAIYLGCAFSTPGHELLLNKTVDTVWIRAHQAMTEQFTVVMMYQTLIIGTFFDAKHQLEVQRLFQQLTAQAHKDYQPSMQLCQLGTGVRSLAASAALIDVNARAFGKMMADRALLKNNAASAAGGALDLAGRAEQFKKIYCDKKDNNGSFEAICADNVPLARINKDIDYQRTFDGAYTLDIDFSDSDMTADEEDLLALSKNLFDHRVIEPLPESYIKKVEAKDEIMDLRSIEAMRSVIRDSFSHQVAEKAKGTEASAAYIKKIVEELGVSAEDVDHIIGEAPSYYAQMEALTNKIYQDPEFYTNLYDKPANVRRTRTALKAIQLMQDRDRFEASLRREMLISLLLEAQLRDKQKQVENQVLRAITGKVSQGIVK